MDGRGRHTVSRDQGAPVAEMSAKDTGANDTGAARPEAAAEARFGEPVIVAKDVTVGYKLHRERKLLTALKNITLTINKGEFVVLLGPSGCGKTTFINAISGIVEPWEGTIEVDGKPVTGPGPDRAMVFQDYALMPWRTVESNLPHAV